ncbi:MAG: hypothetical protein ACLTDR_15030 [Adlercreutzia equolifaciens]
MRRRPNDVTLDQSITDRRRVHRRTTGAPRSPEEREPLSFDAVCSEENTVSLTGVKNPTRSRKPNLRPYYRSRVPCWRWPAPANGREGSLVWHHHVGCVGGLPHREQCGGLADGVNAVNATGYDGWQAFPPMNLEASTTTPETPTLP